ncbi:MAG: FAD-dependent oxidoreductase [Rhodothermales bacterium]|nr:FAD-dependent oxidoreductase [Rhodothermales bacterium]
MDSIKKRVVIIGNGVAGVTAARFIRKWSDHVITIISSETDYFFSRPALMYIFMGHLRMEDTRPYANDFWQKNRIDLLRDHVVAIDTEARLLALESDGSISYDVLIVATGSVSKFFGWPGQQLRGVQGLYGLPDLERMEDTTRGIERAVVVGGSLIGIELAEMLHARRIPVSFLVREKSYMDMLLPAEESEMINREIRAHHIDLRLETELKEVSGDASDRVRGVTTGAGEEIPCQFVGLATGVTPNIAVARGSPIACQRGILVDEFLETNVPGVYAIGDCAEFRRDGLGYRRIDQLWYTGRHQGRSVARTGFYPILGNRVWCRFGCPMAAILGMLQKWFSRFRITTNGGQCISCGNCSTYCEMGIDVRWYAQRGQNVVRSSCVGCGICASVCPRGVLKLENGPLDQRYNGPVLIHNNHVSVVHVAATRPPSIGRFPRVQEDIPILGDHDWEY